MQTLQEQLFVAKVKCVCTVKQGKQ